MIKRLICLCLAFATVFSICGCSNASSGGSSAEWEYEYETIRQQVEKDDEIDEDGNVTESTEQKDNTSVSAPPTTAKPGTELTVEAAGTDPNADYSVSGTVKVSIDTARVNDYEALFDSLEKVYPNIKLKFDYFAHDKVDSAAEYLATRAAANNMPDIVYDDAGSLPTYLVQGWVQPLDEFVANDPDYKKYVPQNLKNDYTYGGKLYALPHQAHYETFLINTDALNALNLKMPSLSWSVSDFEKYCKKAATDKYSAQESFGSLYSSFTNCYNGNTAQYGYNAKTRQFDMSGFSASIKMLLNLKSIPGLEAETLRKSSTNGVSDYIKKFGSGSYSDNFVAFHKGLTLFHGLGTWEYATKRKTVTNFNWVLWTFPQGTPGVMPYHVDHCFMTSSCKNKEAAWQVLRYCTYSYEGNIARLSMYDKENEGKYALQNAFYYPTCTHPDVVAKFKSLPNVGEAEHYMYDNMSKCYRYDMIKLVPDWSNILSSYITPAFNNAISGTSSLVDQSLNEAASKANKAVKDAWSDFESKLAKLQ